nr:hypothetical protein [Candidatus Sigynarchaeota archaeon]
MHLEPNLAPRVESEGDILGRDRITDSLDGVVPGNLGVVPGNLSFYLLSSIFSFRIGR